MTSGMFSLRYFAVFAVLCAGLSGCAVSSYTTAHTLAKGGARFWVAPQALRVGVSASPQTMPFVELGTRYGLTDDVEVGVRLGAGLQADTKIALRRRHAPSDRLTLALAPGVGYIGNFSGTPTGADGDDLHFVGASVPLYATWRLRDALDLTLAPRLSWLMQYVETSSASTTHTVAWGASLNLAWQVSKSVALVPEVSIATPFFRALTGVGTVWGSGYQRVLQAGVAIVFGG